MKLSRVFITMILFCILMIGATGKAFAHPPKEIKAEFDKKSKMLKVNVIHPVKEQSIKQHYIKEIKIYLNDELVIQQNFKKQSSAEAQEVSYVLIDAEKGDKIKIEARCSILGSKEKTLDVE